MPGIIILTYLKEPVQTLKVNAMKNNVCSLLLQIQKAGVQFVYVT